VSLLNDKPEYVNPEINLSVLPGRTQRTKTSKGHRGCSSQ
jgi:hypothetical protein